MPGIFGETDTYTITSMSIPITNRLQSWSGYRFHQTFMTFFTHTHTGKIPPTHETGFLQSHPLTAGRRRRYQYQ